MTAPLTRHDLVVKLAEARRSANLSIRRAASLAKVPASTAQGWFEGKHLPTPALMPNFLALLDALGLAQDAEARTSWHAAITALRSGTVIEESPYVGLRSYTAADSDVYVGRERAYETLVAACLSNGLTVVVGDSGSGKSSLIAAGLMGRACAQGGPLEHLTPLVIPPADLPQAELPHTPTLLVVDQFEDIETAPAEIQLQVFDWLAELPEHVTCVVVLAASSFGFALRDERLATHLDSAVLLGPLTTNEYTRIIEEPARRHGRAISNELVQLALRDLYLYGDPAPGTALPLLSSAMRRCWRAADGSTLEAEDYRATGGLWSALRDEAEATLAGLSDEQQPLARRLLLSMVQTDGEQHLRRKVRFDMLAPEMMPIVNAFLGARLFSREEDQVVISHDALLTHWDRLQEWIDDEKASLVVARRIHLAAQLWDEGGRAEESLMPLEAVAWSGWASEVDAPLLSPRENAFIDASLERAEAQRREQSATIKRLRRRQSIAIGGAFLAVAMALTATFASVRADRYRAEAESATLNAQSRQVSLIADELRPLSPNVAGQLSVAAWAMSESVQTRSAVLTSAGNPMPTRASGPSGNTMVAYEPQNDLLVRAVSTGELTVWHGGDLLSEPQSFASGGGQIFALTLGAVNGRTIAVVGGQQTAALWDLTGEPILLGEYGADTVTYSSSLYEGIAYFGTLDGEILRIDIRNPDTPRELAPVPLGADVAVSALATSSQGIFAGGRRDVVDVFDLDGRLSGTLEIDGTALSISHSPTENETLIGSANGNATLWRFAAAEPHLVTRIDLPALVHAVRHDGSRMLVAGAFGAVYEYDHEFAPIGAYPERTTVVSLGSVNGHILAGTTGGSTTLWDPVRGTAVFIAPDGVELYDLVNGGDVIVVGTSAGARVVAPDNDGWHELAVDAPPDGSSLTYYYDISADGQVLVNQTSEGDLLTFDRDGDSFHVTDSMPDQRTIVGIHLSPSGNYLALGYRGIGNYEIYERSGSTWQHLASAHSWPASRAFSHDERYFAAMNYAGNGAVIWDLSAPSPHQVSEITLPDDVAPMAMSFSPSGDLAIGDNRGEVSIYSLADPTAPVHTHQLRDARSSLTQVSYAHDGTRLLAATGEGQLWVWRVDEDVTLELRLTPGSGAVSGAMWFEDQVIMSADNRAVAWPGRTAEAAEYLCARFGNPLTADEWARLVADVDPVDGCALLAAPEH